MKHVLLAITAIFFGMTLSVGQSNQTVQNDTLVVTSALQNLKIETEDTANFIFNDWQLIKHEIFDNYPDDKSADIEFIKGDRKSVV